MKKALPLLASAAIVACAGASHRVPRNIDPPTASLCELSTNPQRWNGRVVRLQAVLISDLSHTTVLKDKSCPHVFAEVYREPEPGEAAGVDAFFNAVQGDVLDISLRVFFVDSVGRFSKPESVGRFYVGRVLAYHPTEAPPELGLIY